MIIPESFWLAGNRWQVRLVPQRELVIGDGVFADGSCDPATEIIRIYKRLGKIKRLQTYIHECAHAVLYTMGYLEHDEVMVEAVSQFVYQLITTGEEDDDTN